MQRSTISDFVADFPDSPCSDCGNRHLRRLPRKGFLQGKVQAFFGYYPWECPICKQTGYFRKRGRHLGKSARTVQ